jgi:hypothetical protein
MNSSFSTSPLRRNGARPCAIGSPP